MCKDNIPVFFIFLFISLISEGVIVAASSNEISRSEALRRTDIFGNDIPESIRELILSEMLNTSDEDCKVRLTDFAEKNTMLVTIKVQNTIRKLFLKDKFSVARDNRFRQRLLQLLLKAHIGIDYGEGVAKAEEEFQEKAEGTVLATASGLGINKHGIENHSNWKKASHYLELAIKEIIEDLFKNRATIRDYLWQIKEMLLPLEQITRDSNKENIRLIHKALDTIEAYLRNEENPPE